MTISRRHISEVESCLYVAVDQDYITEEEFKNIFDQAEKEKQLIDGMLRYLREYKRTKRV